MKIIILYAIMVLNPTDIIVTPLQEYHGIPHMLIPACIEDLKQYKEINPYTHFVCVEEYIENGI